MKYRKTTALVAAAIAAMMIAGPSSAAKKVKWNSVQKCATPTLLQTDLATT